MTSQEQISERDEHSFFILRNMLKSSSYMYLDFLSYIGADYMSASWFSYPE